MQQGNYGYYEITFEYADNNKKPKNFDSAN